MISRLVRAGIAIAVLSTTASAQFSSDFPGVPRGAISIRGGTQARTEWTFTGNKIPGAAGVGDSIGGGIRVGLGRSYRVADQFELGYDFTLLDANIQVPPSAAAGAPKSSNYMRGMAAYAFKLGAKMRPYSSVDQEGNGIEASFGIAYQPTLKTLYGYATSGDSSRTGGQFGNGTSSGSSNSLFKGNPFASVQSSIMIAAMGSYRSKRFNADAALTNESVGSGSGDPSPVAGYNGFALRVGGAYRLTRGFAIGGSYWGSGAPPWRDDVRVDVAGKSKATNYALLFQFGAEAEGGTDLMISSPTGNFAQSIRVYLRTRTTR